MFKKLIYTFITFFSFLNLSNAQSSLAHEIGIVFGPTFMKSDYGVRNNFAANFDNVGFGVGFVHYINFSCNAKYITYFKEHFKIRSEVSFSNTTLKHHGIWVEGGSNSLGQQQLRAMEGKSSIINLGSQLEYSPFSEIHNFENSIGAFSPYLSLGLQYNFFNIKTSSSMGKLGSIDATYPKYLVPSDGQPFGFYSGNNGVWSIVFGFGARYKLSKSSDLILENRFQYFNSDWVDGLNPNKGFYTDNKYNDWQVWVTFGYVFYLQ